LGVQYKYQKYQNLYIGYPVLPRTIRVNETSQSVCPPKLRTVQVKMS